jgi:predicted Zn-dependent protease
MNRWYRSTGLSCGALLLLSSLSGCTVNPATGEKVFTGGMSAGQELSIGRQQHPQIIKAFGGEYGSPEFRRYIDSIGQLLARTVERRNFKYKFTVLNSGIVNAFALPGGYIYVSRGLLALAETEAEVAGVLAHELGHINALHHGRRQGQEMLAGLGVAIVGAAAGSFGQQIADLGSVVAQGALRSYSREHELESDTLALRYMARAGYNTGAMVEFLSKMRDDTRLEAKKLGKSPDKADEFNYLATHPAPIERVRRARAQAAQYRVAKPIVGRDIYLRKISGMLYGDDPDQGFVRGQVFVHPKLGFRFEVPKQFHLINSDRAVIAKGPGDATIIFDSAPKPSDGPLRYYLTDVWLPKARLQNVESLRVNGLEAATATTEARTRSGQRTARLLAIRRDLHTVYRFVFLTQPRDTSRWATAFRRTSHSFRFMSKTEAATYKPFRIRTVRVRRGDTVASLSRRMAGSGKFSLDQFRVLNGLRGNKRLRPGQLVKIVSE